MLGIWKIAICEINTYTDNSYSSELCSIHEGTKNNALSRIIRNAIYNLHTRKTMIILKLALKNLVIKVTPPFDLLLHHKERCSFKKLFETPIQNYKMASEETTSCT